VAVYSVQPYFQRKVQARMLQSLRSQEWWAQIVGSKVHLARLYEFADDSCQIVDHEGNAYSFESWARAEHWMQEEEYSRVASLIEAGELPQDFKVPGDGKAPNDIGDELLLAHLQESPDIQPFLDRAFFDSLGAEREDVRCAELGCSYGAVEGSTLCRRHHFENVTGRPFIG
jgi:hypothetical protein